MKGKGKGPVQTFLQGQYTMNKRKIATTTVHQGNANQKDNGCSLILVGLELLISKGKKTMLS